MDLKQALPRCDLYLQEGLAMLFKSSFTTPAVATISFCLIFPTVPAAADILHVPGDFPTIQEAIDAAMDGDEVEVHPGAYNENINFLGKAIRIYSTDGPDVTIIDAQQTDTVVTCDSAEGPDSVLEGFTITGGNASIGGGMRNINSSPTVTNCIFTGNTASSGGGMRNFSSSPTVTNCIFTGNTASSGGGMFNVFSSPTVSDCTFSANTADFGGGMFNTSDNSPLVTDCTFSANTADFGAGMFNTLDSSTLVTGCTFSANTALAFGGGMLNTNDSSTLVTDCAFSGNTADVGGAMYNAASSSPTITACSFDSNLAQLRAGGMFNFFSSPSITNCAFTENATDSVTGGGGGAMVNFESNPTIEDCTFTGNTALLGGGMENLASNLKITNCQFIDNITTSNMLGGGGMLSSTDSISTINNCLFRGNMANAGGGGVATLIASITTITNCTFSDNTAPTGAGIFTTDAFGGHSVSTVVNAITWGNNPDQIRATGGAMVAVDYSNVQGGWSGTGNINTDPMFVAPGIGDYRLSSGSPSIDAGNNWGVPVDEFDYDEDGVLCELFPVDLDGNPRFNADEADLDPGCGVPVVVDMGAYEYQFDPADQVTFADLNGDSAVSTLDLLSLLAEWGQCAKGCCLADLDIDGNVGTADLLILLANWGPCP